MGKTKKSEISKKTLIIIVVCTLAAGLLIGGLGMMIYKDLDKGSGTKEAASTDANDEIGDEKADQLADGEVYDFEQAGYIKLGEYKGLKADVQPGDEDVYSAMIVAAQDGKAEKEGGDTVAEGDIVNIDFTGKMDGVKLEDASDEDVYIWVGKGEYIDDFEKGIIGMKVGGKETIDCTFPADYDDETMAGKTVQFTIKLHAKFSAQTAEKLSDGKYKSVQEYYDYEKATELEENRANKGELVWDELRDNAEVKSAPAQMLARTKEDVKKMYTNFAELSGMEVEDLLAQFGMDESGMDEIANDTVSDIMIAKTIASKEGITMDDDFYLKALIETLGYEESEGEATIEKLEEEYRSNTGSRPKDDMLVERVKKFVGEQAVE